MNFVVLLCLAGTVICSLFSNETEHHLTASTRSPKCQESEALLGHLSRPISTDSELEQVFLLANSLNVTGDILDKTLSTLSAAFMQRTFNLSAFQKTYIWQKFEQALGRLTDETITICKQEIILNGLNVVPGKQSSYFRLVQNLTPHYTGVIIQDLPLDANDIKGIHQLLSKNLRKIEISNCPMNFELDLDWDFSSFESLEYFQWSNCYAGDSIVHITKTLPNSLVYLDISKNKMNPTTPNQLSPLLERLTNLATLKLADNNLTPAGTADLLVCICSLKKLKEVDLSTNYIGNALLDYLTTLSSPLPWTHLNLEKCCVLETEFNVHAFSKLPELTNLNLLNMGVDKEIIALLKSDLLPNLKDICCVMFDDHEMISEEISNLLSRRKLVLSFPRWMIRCCDVSNAHRLVWLKNAFWHLNSVVTKKNFDFSNLSQDSLSHLELLRFNFVRMPTEYRKFLVHFSSLTPNVTTLHAVLRANEPECFAIVVENKKLVELRLQFEKKEINWAIFPGLIQSMTDLKSLVIMGHHSYSAFVDVLLDKIAMGSLKNLENLHIKVTLSDNILVKLFETLKYLPNLSSLLISGKMHLSDIDIGTAQYLNVKKLNISLDVADKMIHVKIFQLFPALTKLVILSSGMSDEVFEDVEKKLPKLREIMMVDYIEKPQDHFFNYFAKLPFLTSILVNDNYYYGNEFDEGRQLLFVGDEDEENEENNGNEENEANDENESLPEDILVPIQPLDDGYPHLNELFWNREKMLFQSSFKHAKYLRFLYGEVWCSPNEIEKFVSFPHTKLIGLNFSTEEAIMKFNDSHHLFKQLNSLSTRKIQGLRLPQTLTQLNYSYSPTSSEDIDYDSWKKQNPHLCQIEEDFVFVSLTGNIREFVMYMMPHD